MDAAARIGLFGNEEDYYEIGDSDTNNSGFVGLMNQGATCYLNSLIQALYMTPEFRTAVFNLSLEDVGLQVDGEGEEGGDAKADAADEEEDIPITWKSKIEDFMVMGFEEKHVIKGLQALKGPEDPEAVIEWLFSNPYEPPVEEPKPAKDEAKPEEEVKKKRRKPRKILIELQKLFANLKLAKRRAISTKGLTDSFGWNNSQRFEQHDVHELNRVLFDAIERSLKGTPAEKIVNQLYNVKVVNKVLCTVCGRVSERVEDNQDVTVTVKDQVSLINSLYNFVEPEMLEKSNQYSCESCDRKVDAKRWVCFRHLPSVLIFSLARFEYDFLNGDRKKIMSDFHYPLHLDMNPFTEEFCNKGDSKEELKLKVKSADELSLDDPPIPENHPNPDTLYELFGVIIHSGRSGGFGHYFAYLHDVLGGGNWVDLDALRLAKEAEREKREKEAEEKAKLEEGDEDKENTSENASEEQPKANSKAEGYSSDGEVLPDPLKVKRSVIEDLGEELAEELVQELESYSRRVVNRSGEDSGSFSFPSSSSSSSASKEPKIFHREHLEGKPGWFEFNDSLVEPITEATLRSKFGDDQCAYMLVYRRKIAQADALEVEVPAFLKAEVEKANAQYKEEQETTERQLNQVRLVVYSSSHFSVDERGVARLADEDYEEGVSKLETRMSFPNIDRRLKVETFKDYIRAMFDPDIIKDCASKMRLDEISIGRKGVLEIKGKEWGPEGLSLQAAGASHGKELLAWNGSTIGGKPWDPTNAPLLLRVNHILLASEVSEVHLPVEIIKNLASSYIEVEATTKWTFGTFKNFLSERTGIPFEELLIFKSSSDDFLLPVDGVPETPLESFEFNEDTHLLVERANRGDEAQNTLSEIYSQLKDSLFRIHIIDHVTPVQPSPIISLTVENTLTFEDLKSQVFPHVPAYNGDPNNYRFRRLAFGGKKGILIDEDSTIRVTMGNNTSVILEEGPPATAGEFMVRFLVPNSTDELIIPLFNTMTIGQAKELVMKTAGLEGDYRLRNSDHWGKPGRMFDNEEHTVRSEFINPDSVLVLEKGLIPKSGELALKFLLFNVGEELKGDEAPTPEQTQTQSPESKLLEPTRQEAERLREEQEIAENIEEAVDRSQRPGAASLEAVSNATVVHEVNEQVADSEVDIVMDLFSDDVSGLKEAFGKANDDEDDLKGAIEMKDLSNKPLTSPDRGYLLFSPALASDNKVPACFSTIELEPMNVDSSLTLYQLKQLLIETQPLLSHVESPLQLRIWSKARVFKVDERPLKDYFPSSPLVVQVLDFEEVFSNPEEVIVYLFERDAEAQAFKRPTEYRFNNATRVERTLFEDLVSHLNVDADHLELAKRMYQGNCWQPIKALEPLVPATFAEVAAAGANAAAIASAKLDPTAPPGSAPSSEAPVASATSSEASESSSSESSEKSTGFKSFSHLSWNERKRSSLFFKDGDILAWKDMKKDPENKDAFIDKLFSSKVSWYRNQSQTGSYSSRSYPSTGSHRSYEAALTINVDDFEYDENDFLDQPDQQPQDS